MGITLSVTGMTCDHCVRAVTKALQAVAGAEKVVVSLDAGRARVDGNAAATALLRAVEDKGYKAQVVDAE